MMKIKRRQRTAGLYLVTLLGCLLAFLSFQSPAYSQCGIDWTCQTVDSTGDVGMFTSLAFDPSGKPAISYYDYDNGALKFAYDKNNNGVFSDAGEIITVDGATTSVGGFTSLAFGSGPAISYYDYDNGALKFAYDKNNNGVFSDAGEIITVDGATTSVGMYASLAFGSGPAISYYDNTNDDLKFAYDKNNNGVFSDAGEIITVDGTTTQVGMYTSLAFDSSDRPAISYWGQSNSALKFAYDKNNNGVFTDAGEIITVDGVTDNVGVDTSLAFGSGPAISYYDNTNGALKFAYDKNNNGVFSDSGEIITVDGTTVTLGQNSSLAFGSGPAISYYDWDNSDLKFAYDKNNNGVFSDSGEIITVDGATGDVGQYTSLAFGSGPAISYYDLTNEDYDLKFSRGPVTVGGEVQPVDLEPCAASDAPAGGSSSYASVALWAGLASAFVIGGGILLIKRRRAHHV